MCDRADHGRVSHGGRGGRAGAGEAADRAQVPGVYRAGEVLGVGTLYWDDAGPKLHIHTAIGKDGESLIGCPRRDTRTFLVLEVTIIEIDGIEGTRQFDPGSGMKLLRLKEDRTA